MSRRSVIWGAVIALWLYFLLPATAVLFYELYHLTGIEFVYWGYSAFKAGGYYFGIWPYKLLVCLLVGMAVPGIPYLLRKLRSA